MSIDNATVRELAENNIFRKMTRADINTMLNTPGAEVDVEYALQVLIDEGHKSKVLFPHDVKGIYILAGNVTLDTRPSNVDFIFSLALNHTQLRTISFLNKGAVIPVMAGADLPYFGGNRPSLLRPALNGRGQQTAV